MYRAKLSPAEVTKTPFAGRTTMGSVIGKVHPSILPQMYRRRLRKKAQKSTLTEKAAVEPYGNWVETKALAVVLSR